MGVLALAALGPAPARAEGEDPVDLDDADEILLRVDRDVSEMRLDLSIVGRAYGAADQPQINRVDRRLREGEIHLLLHDYLRASIVLLDVVDDPQSRSHPRYDDCVFVLAEALRQSGNYGSARRYYEELVPRVEGARLKDVVLGLLHLAGETDRYESVDRYIEHLRRASTLSRPDVDYIYGKMLYKSGKPADALAAFTRVSPGTSVSGQASYYAGVSLVMLGRYTEAIRQFRTTLERLERNPHEQKLRELTHISLGRLYQEIGDSARSTDAYQEISQNSPYFADMLHEVAWAYVVAANRSDDPEEKRKKYTLALRSTELLMATSPDSRLYTQARILQGNLQIRLGAPETAYDTFQTLVDRYSGARQQLDEALRREADPKAFFDELVAAELGDLTPTHILPQVALNWALEETDVGRAVDMRKDLAESARLLGESKKLVSTLNTALLGEQRFNVFPGLKSARAKALSVENRLLGANHRLLALERLAVFPSIGDRDRAAIDAIHGRIRALEAQIIDLPKTEEQVESARERIREDYLDASRRAFQLGYRLSSMRAQLVAVEVWFNENRDRLGAEEVSLLEERLGAARGVIRALEEEIQVTQEEILRTATLAGGDGGRTQGEDARREFSDLMAKELALLATHRARVSSEHRAMLERVDRKRAELETIDRDLGALQTNLERRVVVEVDGLKTELAAEIGRLERYGGEHADVAGRVEGLLGPVATETLRAVKQHFGDLVLKADVGIIDVAWARKQAQSDRVSELVKEEERRAEELEAEFQDMLKE